MLSRTSFAVRHSRICSGVAAAIRWAQATMASVRHRAWAVLGGSGMVTT